MKFKDVRTLDTVLSEYGMKPGASTPTSQQSTGANAKANATSPTINKKTPPKKDLGSPTTTPGLDVKEPEQEPKFTPIKAKDIDVDAEYHDDKGNVLGKVISKVGNTPNPDKVVVQDPKGEYQLVDPDEEVQMLNASKLSKLSKSTASSFNIKKQVKHKKNKLKKIKKKMKKLVRKFKLREQGEEQLFEINFNQRSIAKSALKMPIKCGFEAETSWDDVYGSDDDGDWLYEYNWYDIEDFLRDQEGRSAVSEIEQAYEEWIQEKAYDYEGDEVADIVAEREEDEYYLNDFIESELSEDDIEEYKERILDDLPEEDQDEYEDWDFMNWGRQYVEEELLDQYKEWLEEQVRDEGEALDRAFDRARDDYSIDDWANNEYGSWSSCLGEYGYYLYNPDGEGGGQEEVAGYLRDWAEDNSITDEVQSGEYHAGYGDTKQSYWRVEGDPSIDTRGTGSEIISPVYQTPQAMLTEMKSLFTWMDKFDVETNRSTGLHVTMSWNGEKTEPNKVKMAVLLGDKYLLSTFGRDGNSYARSQYDNLKKMGQDLKSDPDNTKTIKQIENILEKGISGDKYSSINFKSDTDRDSGNELIEFRIGGGHDYHQDFDNCAKAVIRYATIMSAGHEDGEFQKEYIKALFKFINKLDKIDDQDVERAKGDIEHPAIDILKDFFGKDNYVTGVQNLNQAFYNLDLYKKFSDPEADAKWKRDVEKYEKGTGEKVDIEEVEQAEPINAYIRPESSPPSKRAKEYLTKAQKNFMIGLLQAGYDLNQNLNRKPVSAKGIGVLRKTIKEFELDYNDLDNSIPTIEKSIQYGGRNYPNAKTRMQRLKNGVDRLFKKDVVSMPEFLSHQQVEKITNGLWSAFASGELQDGNKSKEFFTAYGEAKGVSPELVAQEWDELVRSRGVGEYKDFHGKLTRGHRDFLNFEAGEPINAKGLDKLLAHLKTYPEWNHPVAKGHNPAITGGDSYEDNALSKMMMKMRTRFDAIEELKDDDPAKYYDTIKKLGNIGADLIADVAVENEDDTMGEQHPELRDTEHDRSFDGERYIGMRSRTQERWGEMLDDMARGNPSSPFGESVIMQYKDRTQNYLRSVLDNYYETKKDYPDFYKDDKVSEIVKSRFAAVKEFLTKIDEIAQDIGFDSQADAIAKKKELGNKAKAYDKEHGPKALYTIKGFSFGGDIYISKEAARDMLNLGDDLRDRNLYDKIVFAREDSPHSSQYHTLKAVPHSDYFLALDAKEILENPRLKGNWRINVAKQVQKAWYDRYKTTFDSFLQDYSTLNNNPDIKKLFKDRKVVIDDSLGDGRTGMKGFGHDPLGFEKEELEGPHGEPFSLSAAGAWKVNNPELAKKVVADEKKKRNSIDVQIPIQAGVDNLDGASSNQIANRTNWSSLAKYLKIEAGVNNQGINLLKKVYDQYDSNHNWRPEPDPNVCCMPRYVAVVKAAKEYIEKNYIVSGGNYFRKNADGSVGDDVSAVHGNRTANSDANLGELDSIELDDNSYSIARTKYDMFDVMMSSGIGSYILQADANRLVKLLIGDFSEQLKNSVIKALIRNKENGGEPFDIQQAITMGRVFKDDPRENKMSRVSVFDKFDKLSLQEQIELIAKVDKNKIDEAWSKKYKDSINCSNPKGFSQKAHCDGKKKKANENHGKYYCSTDKKWKYRKGPKQTRKVNERPLTKGEKSDKEKYVKGMKKNKGDFEKRYGKDAKAVMYATATKMAKESVNDFKQLDTINKLLSDHFPVGDLKKQMLAYQAIPVPAMLDEFRRLRAEAGDDACARNIVRMFTGALPKEQQARLDLNESALSEAPMDILDKYDAQQQKYFELKYRVQQACQNPRTANACNKISAELPAIENELKRLRQEIASYTARDADVDAAMKLGGEQKEIDIKRAKAGLKKQVLALVKKAEGIGDTPDEEVIFDKIQQSIADKLSSIIENVQDDESVKLESLTKLLDHAIAGELIDTKALVAAKKGRIDDHVNKNLEPDVIKVFDEYFKGDIFNFIPGGTTSGNYGPAEVGLAIFGNPANKADVGDLEIDGTMFELKGSGYKTARKDGKGYTGLYGARLNSKGINSATAGWNALDKGIKKIVPDIGNVSKDTKGLEPMHLRFMNNGTKEASRYNFNAKGIELLNKEILEPYSNKQKTTELLMGAMKGIITGWKRVPDFDKIVAKMSNDDGTISMQRLWSFYTGLAYESYNIEDDVENILFINSTTRSYYIINNRDEMIKAIASGEIQVKGGVSWNDDQQKASPQYAIA